jgi:hypothetical protein
MLSTQETSVAVAAVLAGVFLATTGAVGQATKTTENPKPALQTAILPCSGSISSSSPADQAPASANSRPHSVTLTWNAAVPGSNAPRDAIKGYYIYRSLISHRYGESDRMNQAPLRASQCVDTTVEPRRTYFYVVKSVTEGGRQSDSSAEIKAVVPSP